MLTASELGEIWRAAGTLGCPFSALVRLLLLTAQRREEVAGMRWRELSEGLDTWTLPAGRAKNHREHVVHLPPGARAILAALPRRGGSDLVFTTTGRTPVSGFSRAKARLDAAVAAARAEAVDEAGTKLRPMPGWRMHDFRRTAVTWLAGSSEDGERVGFPPHVADKLLNHVATTGLSDVGRIYQRAEFLAERKAALEAWTKHVISCGEGRFEEPGRARRHPRRARGTQLVN